MNNWQYTGAILTGVAALITAGIGVYDKLHTVHREVYTTITEQKTKREYGIVDDKDGWVFMRERPDISSPVLVKLLNDTNVEVIGKEGNWFKVYTESGRTGYIFKDRLILFEYRKNN